MTQPRARKKNIEFRMHGLVPTVAEVDSVLLQRLLGNLISNAIDASPDGAAVQIHLARLPQTDASRDWIRIKVIDVGEGISSENLERVFTPYFTTKDRGDGTRGFGLGLAIARSIVQLHGGNLRIASVEKKGTTVEVDLPAQAGPAWGQPRQPRPCRAGSPMKTLLVIAAQAGFADAIRAMVDGQRFRVAHCPRAMGSRALLCPKARWMPASWKPT